MKEGRDRTRNGRPLVEGRPRRLPWLERREQRKPAAFSRGTIERRKEERREKNERRRGVIVAGPGTR